MWNSFFCFKLKFHTKVRFAEEESIFTLSAHNLKIIGKLLVSEVSFLGVTIILAICVSNINGVMFIKRFLIQKALCLLRRSHIYINFLYLNEWTWLSLNLNNHYWCFAPWFMSLLKCTLLHQVLLVEAEEEGIKSCLLHKKQEDSCFDARGNCKEWHFRTPQVQTVWCPYGMLRNKKM